MDQSVDAVSLYIPVNKSTQLVQVFVNGSPVGQSDLMDIMDLLKLELVHPKIWRELAITYQKFGLLKEFNILLSEISKKEAMEAYYTNARESASGELQSFSLDQRARLQKDYERNFVLILNTRASFSLIQNVYSRVYGRELINDVGEATELLNQASQIDSKQTICETFVGKSLLCLCSNDMEAALENINLACRLDLNFENILARLTKAAIHVSMKQYQTAIQSYKEALQINPKLHPNVRVGIGLCYLKIGQFNMAQKAFERALQLEPTNVFALLGLSLISINTCHSLFNKKCDPNESEKNLNEERKLSAESFTLLTQAQNSLDGSSTDSSSHLINLFLCHHLFLRKNFAQAKSLALKIISSLENSNTFNLELPKSASIFINPNLNDSIKNEILSEVKTIVARTFHVQADLVRAQEFYTAALKNNEKNVKANFGAGQMALNTNNWQLALTHFELVNKLLVHNYDTNRILASIYAKLNKSEKAIHCVKVILILAGIQIPTYSNHNNNNNNNSAEIDSLPLPNRKTKNIEIPPDVALEMGSIVISHDPTLAGICYKTAVEALRKNLFDGGKNKLNIPPQVINNAGSTLHKQGKIEAALKHYLKAIRETLTLLHPLKLKLNPSIKPLPTLITEQDIFNYLTQRSHKLTKVEENNSREKGDDDNKMEVEPNNNNEIFFPSSIVTSVYNLALLYESTSKGDRAVELYQSILDYFPKYSDATLRLACIKAFAGNRTQLGENSFIAFTADNKNNRNEESWSESENLLKGVIADNKNYYVYTSAKALLAALYFEHSEWDKARNLYKEMSADKSKNPLDDSYATTGLANIALIFALQRIQKASLNLTASNNNQNPSTSVTVNNVQIPLDDKSNQFIKSAISKYKSALQIDPKNPFAAHGLAVIMALKATPIQAKDALVSIKDSLESLPYNVAHDDIIVNTANLYASLGQTNVAVKLFMEVVNEIRSRGEIEKNNFNKNFSLMDSRNAMSAEILFYIHNQIAHKYFTEDQIKDQQLSLESLRKNETSMNLCRKHLFKALHLYPDDQSLWYNLAVTDEQHAIFVLQADQMYRTHRQVAIAVAHLHNANRIFKRLGKINENSNSQSTNSLSNTIHFKSIQHSSYVEKVLESANVHLEAAKNAEDQMKEYDIKAAQAAAELAQKALEIKLKKEQEALEAERKLKEISDKANADLEKVASEWNYHVVTNDNDKSTSNTTNNSANTEETENNEEKEKSKKKKKHKRNDKDDNLLDLEKSKKKKSKKSNKHKKENDDEELEEDQTNQNDQTNTDEQDGEAQLEDNNNNNSDNQENDWKAERDRRNPNLKQITSIQDNDNDNDNGNDNDKNSNSQKDSNNFDSNQTEKRTGRLKNRQRNEDLNSASAESDYNNNNTLQDQEEPFNGQFDALSGPEQKEGEGENESYEDPVDNNDNVNENNENEMDEEEVDLETILAATSSERNKSKNNFSSLSKSSSSSQNQNPRKKTKKIKNHEDFNDDEENPVNPPTSLTGLGVLEPQSFLQDNQPPTADE